MLIKYTLKSLFSNTGTCAAFKLSVYWLFGLALGGYLAAESPVPTTDFVAVASTDATVLSAVLVLLFPLLISLLLGFLFSPDSVLVAVFAKAVSFALICVSCVLSCGSAGWIISGLLLFSDFLGVPVLLWLWYSILCGKLQKKVILLSVALVFIVALTDCIIISPFLGALF